MFKGSITALVTPFANGAVDEKALQDFVAWQIAEGTNGVVPCGTTGESPTLSHAEHKRVVELTLEVAKGKIPVIAGAGSNNTAEAIDLATHAEKAGADALLVVTPYYNKPNQEGLFRHFLAIDAAVGIPIFIYNIPPRSVIDMTVETMARLFKEGRNIRGVKDATGNLLRPSLQRAACGPDFVQLSGEDGTALGFNAHGGVGCISVTANVAPRAVAAFQAATLAGDYAAALAWQDRLMPLHRALFLEPNPAGPKYLAAKLGKMRNELRLPMVPITAATAAEIDAAAAHAGII
ncbi:4-hydroxy-tetrahydrodipicolinate synthase [Siculibacillus lacustris]|uniref:4-hydroxy-tetrahydrodipicolinate synthase n=1 Tax=Siculibacillus lacustris TaxID=1549641 RepID=A0A4Q9VWU2_9HYPH|nr:4-hydroxy-tetrahydrodipicolinate synthase [Siculibacillus lacustris]TBW39754.1 4-hydroxy-tetrahydrodipicolinate synthase [Siculibacillus lacustris]